MYSLLLDRFEALFVSPWNSGVANVAYRPVTVDHDGPAQEVRHDKNVEVVQIRLRRGSCRPHLEEFAFHLDKHATRHGSLKNARSGQDNLRLTLSSYMGHLDSRRGKHGRLVPGTSRASKTRLVYHE